MGTQNAGRGLLHGGIASSLLHEYVLALRVEAHAQLVHLLGFTRSKEAAQVVALRAVHWGRMSTTAGVTHGEEIDSTDPAGQTTKEEGLALTVKHTDGTDLVFRVRASTKFGKLMEAYANRKGLKLASLKFYYDEKQLSKTQTPASLKMKSGAMIDATSKVGGG